MLNFNNFKLSQKLGLIVVALLVPLAIMTGLFIKTSMEDINFAEKEKIGAHYSLGAWNSLSALIGAVEEERAPSALLGSQADVVSLSSQYVAKLGMENEYQALKQKLDAIGYPNAVLSENEATTAAKAALKDYLVAIGDKSNLALDPDIDSYYSIVLMSVNLPELNINSDALYAKAKSISDSKTKDIRANSELSTINTIMMNTANAVKSAFATAIGGNKDGRVKTTVEPTYNRMISAVEAYENDAKIVIENNFSGRNTDLADMLEKHEALDQAIDGMWKANQTSIIALLDSRIQGFWSSLWVMLSIAGLVALAGLGLSIYISREFTQSLTKSIGAMNRLATQDYDLVIPGNGRKDEIGLIAKGLEHFRDTGKAALTVAMENLRIKTALDNASTNVMLADTNGNIVYLNNAVKNMMSENEADFRKELPSFNAKALEGANMDLFHKNPNHQRGMLERLSSTFKTSIKIGGRELNLTASPVVDAQGVRLGSVVEWADMTLERRIEAEVDRVVTAAVAGDFRERLDLTGKQGFMLKLSEAINTLCANTENSLTEVNRHLGYLANGELSRRIDAQFAGQFDELKNNFNTSCEQLSNIVDQVIASASEIKLATSEITAGTNDLSQRTEQQASSLQETAASMEEMATTIRLNASNAQDANKLASTASTVATSGGDVVAKAVNAMSRIETSSQKISDIIGVIDEIAFQTNLLALNAAVEAARAGDAGKGFAVVAAEVRSLAQRSSGAAKDIKALIATSGDEVKDGVKLVNEAGNSLSEIVGSIKKVSEIVAEIAAASREQAQGVEEINRAISSMDEMTQQNSALVEQNAAASRMLQDQAESMHSRMSFFSLDDDEIVQKHAPAKSSVHNIKTPAKAKARPQTRGNNALKLQDDLRTRLEVDSEWAEF